MSITRLIFRVRRVAYTPTGAVVVEIEPERAGRPAHVHFRRKYARHPFYSVEIMDPNPRLLQAQLPFVEAE